MLPKRYLLYILSIFTIIYGWNGAFILDDPYITLHNARSLLAGEDLTYGTPALTGATSALHLLLVAVTGAVMPLEIGAAFLALAAAIFYVFMLDLALRRRGSSGWPLAALVVTGIIIGSIPLSLANGLETSLAMAVVAAMLAYDTDEKILPFIAGLAPFVRPELGVLSALMLIQLSHKKSIDGKLKIFSIAFLMALPFLIWTVTSTGSLTPNTMSAKISYMAANNENYPILIAYAIYTITITGGLWPIILCLRGFSIRKHLIAILFMLIFISVSFFYNPRSITWNHCRYVAIFVPILLVMIPNITPSKSMRIYSAALLILSLVQTPIFYARLQSERAIYGTTKLSVQQLAESLPPQSRVMIHDAGLIAWYGPHLKINDVVGLKTPANTKIHEKFTREECGWSKALDLIATQHRAQYIILLEDHGWRCIKNNLQDAGWTLDAMPSFGERYRLYRLSKAPNTPLPLEN